MKASPTDEWKDKCYYNNSAVFDAPNHFG